MKVQTLKVPRTAHYYQLGELSADIRHLVIATHGYGQLARKFIAQLRPIAARDVLIIAPEGLSKFYWNGFEGPPVASWMTSEHRLDEIDDYANYLQLLYESLLIQLPRGIQITLFGFSQGVATQLRWIHARQPHFHNLICWAGSIPEDIDYDPLKDYLADKQLSLYYGDQDEFLTEAIITKLKSIIQQKGLSFQYHQFVGKHDIPDAALQACWEKIHTTSI